MGWKCHSSAKELVLVCEMCARTLGKVRRGSLSHTVLHNNYEVAGITCNYSSNHGSTSPRMKYFSGTCPSSEALCTATWTAAGFQLYCDLMVFLEECQALFGTFERVKWRDVKDSRATMDREILHSRMTLWVTDGWQREPSRTNKMFKKQTTGRRITTLKQTVAK